MASKINYVFDKKLIRPSDLLYIKDFECEDRIIFHSTWDRDIPLYHDLTDSLRSSPDRYHDEIGRWLVEHHRYSISVDVIDASLDLLDSVLQHPAGHALLLVEIIAHATKACEDFDYALALILAWSVTEKLLSIMWLRFIEMKKAEQVGIDVARVPVVDKNREKRLLDFRSYTASVIAETLAFQGILPFDLYTISASVRKSRNDWSHKLLPVKREQAGQAIELATGMLSLVERIDLKAFAVIRLSFSAL